MGGAVALAEPLLIEPRWLDLTRSTIRLRCRQRVRILQLTDLHLSWPVPLSLIQRAIAEGLAQRPDIICLTGDFITHREDFDSRLYIETLRPLAAAHPTFAILGNHDGGSWAKTRRGYDNHRVVESMLEQAGIQLLHNRSVAVNSGALTLVGVGDLWSEELDAAEAFRSVRENAPVVLLSHNPDSKEVLQRYRWDLMLSGHTHGGQVILPLQGPRYAPVKDYRFVAGLGEWDGRKIYVSRGVGSLGGVRFRCRPEVTVLDLEPS